MERNPYAHIIRSIATAGIRMFVGAVLLCAGAATAASQITLPDTVRLRAGERSTIDVLGSLDVDDNSEVSISLAFTPSTLRPVAASGSMVDGFGCSVVQLRSLNLESSNEGTFALTCDSARTVRNGRICALTIEGLVGADTLGGLTVTGITVNGMYQPIDSPMQTVVIVDGGSTIAPSVVEGIAGNFPNPFSATTRIEYVVTTPGMVAMDIRDLSGRLFYTIEPTYHNAGTHSIEYRPKIWEMSSGHYLLRLTTPSGTYLHTMTVEK